MAIFNALIRTHHITSRKKVAALSQAAKKHDVHALLRSGSPPGIMYAEGSEAGVSSWVAEVKRLRYKDYNLLRRPAPKQYEHSVDHRGMESAGLHELNHVKEFGSEMERLGVLQWWRKAMEFDTPNSRL